MSVQRLTVGKKSAIILVSFKQKVILLMRKSKFKNLIRVTLAAAVLLCLCLTFCACHVFAWYVPKQYDDEKKNEIYAFIKDELLTKLDHIIASVTFSQDGLSYDYNVFSSENKTIISYYAYNSDFETVTRGLYFDGVLKEWDVVSRAEQVTDKDISDCGFLFERIRSTADYFKTDVIDVAPYRSDSYFHECFPWGMGMAQMYYEIEGRTVSAFWTVEKESEVKKGLPLVFNAELYCGTETDSVSIDTYGSPYGIDERIANVKANYEERKEYEELMLNKSIGVKIGDETLQIALYNNEAARELYARVKQSEVTLTLDDYGGFEKVGELGFNIPASDENITAKPQDVMLYQGNKLVFFYGENTGDYTRIGLITGYSDEIFKDVIQAGQGKITVTLTLTRE